MFFLVIHVTYAALLLPCHQSKDDQVDSTLDIVSLRLSFYLRYLYRAYVAIPAPTATNNISPFFVPLMDNKNLVIRAQVAKALLLLQI